MGMLLECCFLPSVQSKLGPNQPFTGQHQDFSAKMETGMAAISVRAYFNRHYPEEPLGGDGICPHFLSFQTKSKRQTGNRT